MSTAAPAATPHEQLLLEISGILKELIPDITKQAEAGLVQDINNLISKSLEAEKKVEQKAISDIFAEKAAALEALKKELKEAEEQIANKEKSAREAYAEALSDWTKQLGAKDLAAGISLVPKLLEHIDDVIASGKAIKSRHDITINAPKLIGSIISLIVTVMTLVILVMQQFR